ncbi:hypothetical protein LX36DRAFT_704804 [Colletotrichum falcatum]|nr:hypothetical protein LX36DRAFT_704804 [Colletotrichum falcatum]
MHWFPSSVASVRKNAGIRVEAVDRAMPRPNKSPEESNAASRISPTRRPAPVPPASSFRILKLCLFYNHVSLRCMRAHRSLRRASVTIKPQSRIIIQGEEESATRRVHCPSEERHYATPAVASTAQVSKEAERGRPGFTEPGAGGEAAAKERFLARLTRSSGAWKYAILPARGHDWPVTDTPLVSELLNYLAKPVSQRRQRAGGGP